MPVIKGNNKDNRLIGQSDVFGVTNSIYGYGGNDRLEGGFHADNHIWGGTGNDTIEGGSGVNRLFGEDGNDTIRVFWDAPDSQLFGGAGNDTLISGSSFPTSGGRGIYMDGGVGADSMHGGSGGDTFIVDNAKDQVIETWVPDFDNVPNPIDTMRASVSFSLGATARVELLETTDARKTTAINLAGSNISQTMIGNAGANVLDGKSGNDLLIGGLGADTLIGGAGDDTASYALASAGVLANLANASANTGEAKGDRFSSVENIIGSRHGDKLYGDNVANKLSGGTGNDSLSGGAGLDALKGDAGNDSLSGGLEADVLSGGSGKDAFVFSTALGPANVDRITDFSVADDTIYLENAIFTKLAVAGVLGAAQFAANKSGLATDKLDRIIYETDTGKLLYDADGNGSAKAMHFATAAAGLSIAATDFLVF